MRSYVVAELDTPGKLKEACTRENVIEALWIKLSDLRVMECRDFVGKETGSTIPEPSGWDESLAGWSRRNDVAGSGRIRQEELLLVEMEVVVMFCEGELGWIFDGIADMDVLVLTALWREDGAGGIGGAGGWPDEDGESVCGRVACSAELFGQLRRGDITERVCGSSKVVTGVCGGEEGEGHMAVNRGCSSGRKNSQGSLNQRP